MGEKRTAVAEDLMGKLTQDMARALTEAGYMTVARYLELCRENGWVAQQGAR